MVQILLFGSLKLFLFVPYVGNLMVSQALSLVLAVVAAVVVVVKRVKIRKQEKMA